jgi:hypothetical protein
MWSLSQLKRWIVATTRRKTRTKKKASAKKTNGRAAKLQVTDDETKGQFAQLTAQVNAAKIQLADAEMGKMAALTRLSQLEGQRRAFAEEVGKDLLGSADSDLAGWTFMVDTLEFVRNATA